MSTVYVAQLNNASMQINRYLSFALLILGCIGNILNCLVFIQRPLRSNPCIIYFLVASVTSIITLITGLLPRLLGGLNAMLDLTSTDPVLCKLRATVLLISRNTPPWLIVLATIDRYLVTSSDVSRRQMSNLKQAYRWITITCVISFLIWIEVGYCFDANLIGTPLKCYAKSDICRIYNELGHAVITALFPLILMFIFGFRTITNLRQVRRLRPLDGGNNIHRGSRKRQIENNLTRMLIIQVIVWTIFSLPQAIFKCYITHTFYLSKLPEQIALENFLYAFLLLLSFVPYCVSFYVFLFTGSLFQETLPRIGQKILGCLVCIER